MGLFYLNFELIPLRINKPSYMKASFCSFDDKKNFKSQVLPLYVVVFVLRIKAVCGGTCIYYGW
jgi:hypothetical protein